MATISPIIRVFFSSTFADFQEERDALQQRVFPSLRRYCLERNARFLPIDLRWGISEAASTDQYIVSTCLEEITRCQRVSPYFNFVALLGNRYGSRLLPESILQSDFEQLIAKLSPKNRRLAEKWYRLDTNAVPSAYTLRPRIESWKKDAPLLQSALIIASNEVPVSRATALALTASVTEQEIDAGIFQAPAPSQPFIFHRRFVSKRIPKLYKESTGWGKKGIIFLQDRLWQEYGANCHTYLADFAGDHLNLEAFCTQIEQILKERIDAALAQEPTEDISSFMRWSFARDRLAYFTGQQEALAYIQSYLAAPSEVPLLITGPAGIGKTTLLLKAAEEARLRYPTAEHRWFFIGGSTPIADVKGLLQEITRDLLATYSHPNEMTIPDSRFDLDQQLPLFLALALPEHPLILFIDALDQLEGTNVTRWIPLTLPPHVHLLISIMPDRYDGTLRHLLPATANLTVPALPEAIAEDLLNAWLANVGRTLTSAQRAAIMAYYAINPNPLALRMVVEFARRRPSWQETISLLPSSALDLIQAFLEKLEQPSRHGQLLVAHTLGLIAAGKHGLTEDEVLDVISLDSDLTRRITRTHPDMPESSRLPTVLWARLYSDLEWALTEREIDHVRVLTFYHRQISEAVSARYLVGDARMVRHQDLASYYDRRAGQTPYLVNTPERPWAVINERMVSELAYQQAEGHLRDDLKQTLYDAEFLQARIQAATTQAALQDIALLKSDIDGQLLGQTLRLSMFVLDQSPVELINQIHGRTATLETKLHHRSFPTAPQFSLQSRSLFQAGGSLLQVFKADPTAVACAVLPDGRRALTGHQGVFPEDPRLLLWDLGTGETIRVFQGHTYWVNACVVLPDGRYALSASFDQTLRLWDLETGEALRVLHGHTQSVIDCAVLPDNRQALSCSTDETLRLWDLKRDMATIRAKLGHLT